MNFLLNVVFGLVAGWFVYYILNNKAGVDAPIAVLAGVVIGFVVYFANIAVQVVR